jgi:hypothetical protein
LLAAMAFAATLLGCASTPPRAERTASATDSRVEPMASFSERGWGRVVSERFFVAIPLPDAKEWRVDDSSGRWLAAMHVPTKSMLWVRAWREGSVVNHRACEAVARGYRPDLFGHDEGALVDRRPLGAPAGFDTEVGFTVSRAKGALGAVAAASGARIRQCIVMVYATRAEGADAESVAADRIGFIVDRVFARAESRTVEDRIAPLAPR